MTRFFDGRRRAGAVLLCFLAGCGGSAAPHTAATVGDLATSCNALPAAPTPSSDDWSTFAHDQEHTGCDSGNTTISRSNVAGLHLAWKFAAPEQIVASPIAVDGSVYVATLGAGALIALDASTGKQLWLAQLGAADNEEIRATPVYDSGLVFIGTHDFAPDNTAFPPLPSTFFALSATTGKIVWQQSVQGTVRSSPAIADGNVYVDVSGGDPPFCLQGGIDAFNEQTGMPVWRYYVDPTSDDGGSVWSPVGFDGTHLVFGTGNTCVQTPLSANAVVALDPATGNVAWQINTADPLLDDDVGGGVMMANGSAVALGKNGTLYFMDSTTGAALHEVALDTTDGGAGYSTPATDGTTIVVGTSAVSSGSSSTRESEKEAPFFGRVSATGGGGRLLAFDFSGNLKWSIATQNAVRSSAAIANGIAFATIDSELVAVDIQTGKILWSYTAPASMLASPVVVRSGVYAADSAGNVYKFTL